MLYLLDTNMASYVLRGRSKAARQAIETLPADAVVALSVITEAELRYGLEKRPDASKLRGLVEQFLRKMQVLAWDRAEARVYGELRAALEAQGKSLGSMDIMIAAQAVSAGAVLVTNDKAFQQVSQLHAVVNWATDV